MVQPSCFPRDLFTITCQRSAALFVLHWKLLSIQKFDFVTLRLIARSLELKDSEFWRGGTGCLGRREILWTSISPWNGFTKWEVALIKRQFKMFHNQVLETFWFTRRLRDLLRLTRLPRSPEELSSSSDFGLGWLRRRKDGKVILLISISTVLPPLVLQQDFWLNHGVSNWNPFSFF